MKKTNDDYKITALEGVDAVRKVPGMYLGQIEPNEDGFSPGYDHMLLEVIDNSIDEFLAGFCERITITFHKDGSVSVIDNGRGIPVYYMEKEKMNSLEAVLVKLHAGGKFSRDNYKVSGGLHGVGLSICNFLSFRLRAIIFRDNKEYTIAFQKGKKIEDISNKPSSRADSGTLIRFIPDPEIFARVKGFNMDHIRNRLKELSFLCEGLEIILIDEKQNTKEKFSSSEGINSFVKDIDPNLFGEPIGFSQVKNDIEVSVALQWTNDTKERTLYYTNNIHNMDGGSHMAGFKSSLTRTINSYIANSDTTKTVKKASLSGDDIREGLIAVVSIRHPNPRFSSQTKDKLVSEDARTAVDAVVSEKMGDFLEQNPTIAKKIVNRCVDSWKAREAARKAREAVRKSSLGDSLILPGKLADCSSKNPEECEIWITEGLSAGGSCKNGRDRHFQAILPLRGKVLNIEKSEYKKVVENKELMSLVMALGTGIGKNFNIDKLRYYKVCLACDADVDGSHIRTLLLTFFFRQMPQLIEGGHIYVAVPPLYRIDYRGVTYYLKNETALRQFVEDRGLNEDRLKIQRFKGLGEMSAEQLWDTTLNPETRQMLRVNIENYAEADRIFSILMGDQVEPRKDFIVEHSGIAKLDI